MTAYLLDKRKQKQMFVIQCCIIYQRPKVNELKVINIGDCIFDHSRTHFFYKKLRLGLSTQNFLAVS